MNTYIVLLRAINVGGRNKIPMAELRDTLSENGYDDVATYLQSGNIVVRNNANAKTTAAHIERLIKQAFGHSIAVIVRDPEQLQEVADHCPYPTADPKQLGVVFLQEPSDAPCDATAFAPDECTPATSHVYVHCPTGFGKTKLTNAWVEKQTDSAGTRRNWNTVVKLVAMAQSYET